MHPSFASQSIRMDSIPNARELKGYVMEDGRKVKAGRLLRCGDLGRASDADLRRLSEEFRLAVDFDFRMEMEVRQSPDRPVEGAEYFFLPTLDPVKAQISMDELQGTGIRGFRDFVTRGASHPYVQEFARSMYVGMVDSEYTQLQYAVFFQKILSTPDGAILWHCSQGKDRTGLGTAFILFALGASRETVLADYRITNEAFAPEIEKATQYILSLGGGEAELTVVNSLVGANEAYFIDALDLIDRKYGSMQDYLRDILLVSEADQATLRDRYLE